MTSLATGSPEARSGNGLITCGTPTVTIKSSEAHPLVATGDEMKSVEERFWAKVEKTEGCWNWVAVRSDGGYGLFWSHSREKMQAHRFAYELLVGPIPNGLTIDHLCRNRGCVRPSHLEPVTMRENTRRGVSIVARQMAQRTCVRGHPLEGDNIRSRPDRPRTRVCKECGRLSSQEWSMGHRTYNIEKCKEWRARRKAAALQGKREDV